MDGDATFWQERYVELLQTHMRVVALLTQEGRAEKLAAAKDVLGELLRTRAKPQFREPEESGCAAPS